MSTPAFVSGKGRARDGTVHCGYSEEGTRFSLNSLHYRKLPDCHHKGRFGQTLQHVPNSSHWRSRDEPLQPRGFWRPPRAAAKDPWGIALWLQHARAAANRREPGLSPGAGGEAARAARPGEPRVTHGAHPRPAGRPAPLGARQGRERTLPWVAADTKSGEAQGEGTRGELRQPQPQRRSLPASPTPAPPHSTARPSPPRTEPSATEPPPAPGLLVRGDHPEKHPGTHRPRRGSSFSARAAAF